MDWLAVAGLILAGAAGLLLLLLAIPVELALRVERAQGTHADVAIGWFAGRLTQRLVLLPRPEPEQAPAPEETEEPGPDPDEATGPSVRARAVQGIAVVRSPGFLAHTWGALVDLVRSFSVHRLALWGRIGTGDPADTGALYGRIQAGMPAVWAAPRVEVNLTPDFDRTVLEGGGELVLRATPLRLLWTTLAYALSPTTIRAARAGWRARPDA